jgi:ubiquinone/menaquinone biosynthesis C-methylase UbiE
MERGERYQARAKKRALELLDVRPGQRVLEVGIGTGALLATLSRRTEDARSVVGIDIAGGVIRRAKVRLAAEPQGARPFGGTYDAYVTAFGREAPGLRVQ